MPESAEEILEATFALLERTYADTPQGKKRAALLTRKLAAYFRSLRKPFPIAKTLAAIRRHPINESMFRYTGDACIQLAEAAKEELEKELMLLYRKWVEGHSSKLEAVLVESIEQSSADGFTGELDEWIKRYKLKAPPAGLDALVPKALIKWTRTYAAKLVKGLDEATAKQLAGVIARGMEAQRGIPGIARDIRGWADESLVEMSKSRAENIARTETNTAFSKGNNAGAKAVGSQEKEWIKKSKYPCPDICEPNSDAGRIKFDDSFPSGDEHTPGHNRCTCDVAYYGATKLSTGEAIGL